MSKAHERVGDVCWLKWSIARFHLCVDALVFRKDFAVLVELNDHPRSWLSAYRKKAGDGIEVLVEKAAMNGSDTRDLRGVQRRAQERSTNIRPFLQSPASKQNFRSPLLR
ncbi:hypothetical protein [Caulobacter sp. UC70_42]|uniref:hypothetical protein n=1 Tax=Caulobacter sp. UC70_42 TaxID=3374551 RepID=UPI00375668D9